MSRKRNQLSFSQNCCLIPQIRDTISTISCRNGRKPSKSSVRMSCVLAEIPTRNRSHARTLRYSICSTIRFFPSHKFLLNYKVVPVHVMKAYGEVKVEHGTFLNSVLNLGKKSASRPDRFNSSEGALCTHCIGRWVGHSPDVWKRKWHDCLSRESNHNSSTVAPKIREVAVKKQNYICRYNNLPTTCFGLDRPSSGWDTTSEEKYLL